MQPFPLSRDYIILSSKTSSELILALPLARSLGNNRNGDANGSVANHIIIVLNHRDITTLPTRDPGRELFQDRKVCPARRRFTPIRQVVEVYRRTGKDEHQRLPNWVAPRLRQSLWPTNW